MHSVKQEQEQDQVQRTVESHFAADNGLGLSIPSLPSQVDASASLYLTPPPSYMSSMTTATSTAVKQEQAPSPSVSAHGYVFDGKQQSQRQTPDWHSYQMVPQWNPTS